MMIKIMLFTTYIFLPDTPQNSPQHKGQTKLNDDVVSLNNGSIPSFRTRKLSNSSMASDVSFRTNTAYDAPSVYHLQSDMESASELEDSTPGLMKNQTQFDMISKEQLHNAYKRAMERYEKYRENYTDLAKKYRELERHYNKAKVSGFFFFL